MKKPSDCLIDMSDHQLSLQATWVGVTEAAKKTGYNAEYVRRLARQNLRLPEDQREIQVRKDAQGYSIWLPDLIRYSENYRYSSSPDFDLEALPDDETWVNVSEGAEITGYSREHIKWLAMKNWKLPENQRQIRLHKRSSGYDIWLPDLMAYIRESGHGPKRKRKVTP